MAAAAAAVIADSDGGSRWRQAFEPFGIRTAVEKLQPVAEISDFAYTGADLESSTGEYHLRARDYHLWGFFAAPDPLTPNITDPYISAYVYANQRPTAMVDPTGRSPQWLGEVWSALQSGETWKTLGVGAVGGTVGAAEHLPVYQQVNALYAQAGLDSTDLFYQLTDHLVGVDGTERSTQVGEFFAPIPAGTGFRLCKVGVRVSEKVALGRARGSLGGLEPVNVTDPAALALAKRIGGVPSVKFSKGPDNEFDVVSDKYIGQAKPANFKLGSDFRNQAKVTFEAALQTKRVPYFQFDGPPHPDVLRAIRRYEERYNIRAVVDPLPLGR